MCDFKPGDEVVCVRTDRLSLTVRGRVYTVESVVGPQYKTAGGLLLVGVESGRPFGAPYFYGHNPARFRKVQRRDLKAWLKTAVDVPALDKSRPSPAKRERV